jgi:hypothetical protein
MKTFSIIEVTPENVDKEKFFCVKNINDPGFGIKKKWFIERYNEGLRIRILKNQQSKAIGFIEYVPADFAWRPVEAPGFMFVHCMFVYANDDKRRGNGSLLLKSCEQDSLEKGYSGVCVMTSEGTWITNKELFLRNGYSEISSLGRFELLAKKFNETCANPILLDWTQKQEAYSGWNLVYADQCPWHGKAVKALQLVAAETGIELHVKRLSSAAEAKESPSGFGVFSLIKDGQLIEDHYISETRFRNILNKELKLPMWQ